ncbi:MAG TPA: ATP-binding protein [Solirubrobacteraceae bacterium]|nr:ATP-binding protein [Solirubrobacteraceae bacterium]
MQSVARNLNETYRATPEAVADARGRLAGFAAAAGATPEQVDAVRLAVSEAMTNSVIHAYREERGSVYVNAAVASGELWILVSDDGCGLTPGADRPGLGLGLGLISQVADDFAVVSRASGGTEVRIRFNLAPGTGASSSGSPGLDRRSRSRSGKEPGQQGFSAAMSPA